MSHVSDVKNVEGNYTYMYNFIPIKPESPELPDLSSISDTPMSPDPSPIPDTPMSPDISPIPFILNSRQTLEPAVAPSYNKSPFSQLIARYPDGRL